jgi:hypothetical protein
VSRSHSTANRSHKVPTARRSKAEPVRLHAQDALRKTGIRVIGDMPWGAHICIFYETKDDLLDTAVPIL